MNQLITNNKSNNFFNHITANLNGCESFIFNVAFINYSGIQLLLDIFKELEQKNIKGKILTSTYLNFTDPEALRKIKEFKNIEVKVYDSNQTNIGFHSKAYIFEYKDHYKTIIGSSNITSSAFKRNIEWNIQTTNKKDTKEINNIFDEFNYLWEQSYYVSKGFLENYKRYKEQNETKSFKYTHQVKENYMQKQALEKIEFFRANNQNKALAIAATGTGKTYLSMFDVKFYNPKRILFIVHRENILLKAKESFENQITNKTHGLYTGNKKENKEYLYTTIQTMSSKYGEFKKEEFDYIIVDEAHHISSPSYKKVLEYFEPKFLLGLTATPNRMDGENIYKYFDDNIACDIRLNDALDNQLVVPFHYYGITDIEEIDYTNIDISKVNELSKLLMVNNRVEYIIEKLNFYTSNNKKRKVLGFCSSKEHANYMSIEFNKKRIESISLTSVDSINYREDVIKKLEDDNDSLEVIFSVDIFNEGIDIPSVDIVLMLRPTNSPIVFTQQLGRGLRKSDNKEFLTVLDFIGNHNKAYLIALALIGNKAIDKDSVKLSLLNNFANMQNVHISMDEISKQRILDQINNENFNSFKYLKEKYLEIKSKTKSIPTIVDFLEYDEFVNPIDFIDESKSYIEFVSRVERTEELKSLCKHESFLKAIRFIEFLLPIRRIHEFVVIKYLLRYKEIDINKSKTVLSKYLKVIDAKTIEHSFRYLDMQFLDKGQLSRYEKLVEFKDGKLVRNNLFELILQNEKYKKLIENSLEYGIISYEKSFGIEDYGMPYLKLYEKYDMLNTAQLCNFDKIHSSFRGSGFLKYKNDFFLFITIEKDKFNSGVKYINDFKSAKNFTFVSKPLHSQEKGDGQKLCENKKYGIKLHVFARKFSHVDKKVQRFLYLGLADTVEYSGNKPITLELELQKELPNELYDEFTQIAI